MWKLDKTKSIYSELVLFFLQNFNYLIKKFKTNETLKKAANQGSPNC